MSDAARREFEVWRKLSDRPETTYDHNGAHYLDAFVQDDWQAWQAARARPYELLRKCRRALDLYAQYDKLSGPFRASDHPTLDPATVLRARDEARREVAAYLNHEGE